jgi:PIN domain nuclease of toxin-antitoxin system
VRILLDTHLLLWSVASSRRLPRGARALILDDAALARYGPLVQLV